MISIRVMSDSPIPDDEAGLTEAEGETKTQQSLLNRRNYLRLTGTAAASVAFLGASGVASAEDYRTVVVPAGEEYVYRVGDNETLENYLFDISNNNADVRIRPSGSGWTVRNIGIKGFHDDGTDDSDDGNQSYMIGPEVDAGGTGLIENVYMGDGAATGYGTGIKVAVGHAGELTIRNCYFEDWPGNGIYGSSPGRADRSNAGYGDVKIEQCYARNNNLSNFRIGTNGSYVRDSVIHVDSDVPGGYNKSYKENARGVWVREGADCTIRNCDILLEHPDGSACVWAGDNDESGSMARVRDSQVDARGESVQRFCGNCSQQPGTVDVGSNVGQNPDVSELTGAPASPEIAASGIPSTVTIYSPDGSGAGYSLTVSTPHATKTTANGASINSGDDVRSYSNTTTLDGGVGGGKDSYQFSGRLASLTANEEYRHDIYTSAGPGGSKTITINSPNGTGASYNFSVTSNDLTKSTANGASINDNDYTTDSSANGQVGGGKDSYEYSGYLYYWRSSGSVGYDIYTS